MSPKTRPSPCVPFKCAPWLALGLAILLTGCGTTHVVLRQPATNQLAECVNSLPGLLYVLDNAEVPGNVESCAQNYQQQGYQRLLP